MSINNLPTLRHLQYLLALEDKQSFSHAATACHVTQSTLSAGIRELEELLGQTVADRQRRRKVTLTPFGAQVSAQARRVMEEAYQIQSLAALRRKPLGGPFRLGVIPIILPYWLPPFLPALKADYPELELYLHEDLTDNLLQSLRRGDLEAVIMAFPYDIPALASDILFEEEIVLAYAANSKRYQFPASVRPEDIDQSDLLMLEDGHCLSEQALDACAFERANLSKQLNAAGLNTLLRFVAADMGITLIPEMMLRSGDLPDGIEVRRFAGPAPKRRIGVVWDQSGPVAADVHHLITCLKN